MKQTQDTIRVLVISSSARKKTNYPAASGKSSFLMERVKKTLPKNWIVDTCDLGNEYGMPKIQPCNGCVSTSMALCTWPCNCYKRHSFFEPDLLWDEDIYGRIYAADVILVISPIYWHGPTSSIKLLFDRLVCANGGNPDPKTINKKDANLAVKLENSPQWKKLSHNHLEGKTAAFFIYGDEGADESDADGMPTILKHKEYFDPKKEALISTGYKSYEPIIFQLRYSGIEAPDELVHYLITGKGEKYNKNQIEALKKNLKAIKAFDQWALNVKNFVEKKGKVTPGKYAVPLRKPDSEMNPFLRQLQLLARKTIGSLILHPFGYFFFRYVAKKRALK
jgi:multimeric flavodoxin WrbA